MTAPSKTPATVRERASALRSRCFCRAAGRRAHTIGSCGWHRLLRRPTYPVYYPPQRPHPTPIPRPAPSEMRSA